MVNMSVGTPVSDPPKREELCANASAGGVRSAVRAAEDAGVLMVAAAGNYADVVSFCSVSNLASYPDTLAVGATDNVQDLNSHATVDLADSSSRGSNFVVLSDHNTTVTVPMLDLVATGTANLVAGVNTTGYHSDAVFGTSFSAPQIAGAAGLFLDWAYDRGGFGGWEHNPYVIRTMLSVMGDGHTEGGDWVETVSNDWGFGYLRFLSMDGFIGTGARHWSVWWVTAGTGDVFEWSVGSSGAESSTVNGWKFAAVWDYNTFNDSPNMTFELIDKCPSSGGEVLIRRATKRALKQRMRLRANEMSTKYHGRCLWVRANVNHANGSVPLYMAEYAYTNSRLFHDM